MADAADVQVDVPADGGVVRAVLAGVVQELGGRVGAVDGVARKLDQTADGQVAPSVARRGRHADSEVDSAEDVAEPRRGHWPHELFPGVAGGPDDDRITAGR